MQPDHEQALRVLLDENAALGPRLDAVATLAASGDRSLVFPLASVCGESLPPLRDVLITALGKLNAREVLAGEIDGADGPGRKLLALLLGGIGDPGARGALERLLQDTDPRVREQAASALARLADPASLPVLVSRLLQDGDPDVRAAAAQALGEIGGPRAMDALEQASRQERDQFTIILIERSLLRIEQRNAA